VKFAKKNSVRVMILVAFVKDYYVKDVLAILLTVLPVDVYAPIVTVNNKQ
jgi:hypothetical protein